MSDIITTAIAGLEAHLEPVFGDPRGYLARMLPYGAQHPDVSERGIGNIYMSVATGKHIGRAAHFHFKNHEIFFTLSGTALWLFHDFREGSPTFGQNAGLILGYVRPPAASHPVHVLEDKVMARIIVPTGVYHAYWPLTDEKVIVAAVASIPHDESDYDRRPPSAVPGFFSILEQYGINISKQP